MASIIGSVFLGDSRRHRVLSTTSSLTGSPPSTPSAALSMPGMLSGLQSQSPTPASPKSFLPASREVIEPVMSLELRLRWLEAIVYGLKQDKKGKERADLKPGDTMSRAAKSLQQQLDSIVDANDGLKRFMSQYDQHAHLLTPSFALSGILPDPPTYQNMSANELEAFLAEMESDIRAADRDMVEIEALDKKGITGAGKLADYEMLEPRMHALATAHHDNLKLAADLESRITGLVERHATHIDTLSELFVAWDEAIMEAETKLSRLERDRHEQRRLGFVQ
ncbi:hypothetical protein C8J56DRAFT_972205 [Mycena floridula]|nr:hypothetical protein C8J56DRAFT_972205 [Mycena floridula]